MDNTRPYWQVVVSLMFSILATVAFVYFGFTIAEYGFLMALVCALIIAVVTFIICMAGLAIGRKFGTKLSGKASILGGVILHCTEHVQWVAVCCVAVSEVSWVTQEEQVEADTNCECKNNDNNCMSNALEAC